MRTRFNTQLLITFIFLQTLLLRSPLAHGIEIEKENIFIPMESSASVNSSVTPNSVLSPPDKVDSPYTYYQHETFTLGEAQWPHQIISFLQTKPADNFYQIADRNSPHISTHDSLESARFQALMDNWDHILSRPNWTETQLQQLENALNRANSRRFRSTGDPLDSKFQYASGKLYSSQIKTTPTSQNIGDILRKASDLSPKVLNDVFHQNIVLIRENPPTVSILAQILPQGSARTHLDTTVLTEQLEHLLLKRAQADLDATKTPQAFFKQLSDSRKMLPERLIGKLNPDHFNDLSSTTAEKAAFDVLNISMGREAPADTSQSANPVVALKMAEVLPATSPITAETLARAVEDLQSPKDWLEFVRLIEGDLPPERINKLKIWAATRLIGLTRDPKELKEFAFGPPPFQKEFYSGLSEEYKAAMKLIWGKDYVNHLERLETGKRAMIKKTCGYVLRALTVAGGIGLTLGYYNLENWRNANAEFVRENKQITREASDLLDRKFERLPEIDKERIEQERNQVRIRAWPRGGISYTE